MKKIIFLMGLCFSLTCFSLTGCNTIHGMGQDIEKGGEAIKKSTQ